MIGEVLIPYVKELSLIQQAPGLGLLRKCVFIWMRW